MCVTLRNAIEFSCILPLCFRNAIFTQLHPLQNSVSGICMDAVFELGVHERVRDLKESTTEFYLGRVTTALK